MTLSRSERTSTLRVAISIWWCTSINVTNLQLVRYWHVSVQVKSSWCCNIDIQLVVLVSLPSSRCYVDDQKKLEVTLLNLNQKKVHSTVWVAKIVWLRKCPSWLAEMTLSAICKMPSEEHDIQLYSQKQSGSDQCQLRLMLSPSKISWTNRRRSHYRNFCCSSVIGVIILCQKHEEKKNMKRKFTISGRCAASKEPYVHCQKHRQ